MIATTTVDSVPRDIEYIRNQLPVSHQYKVLHEIGVLNTEDAKLAFHNLNKEEKAQAVYTALLEIDKKGTSSMNPQIPGQMSLPMGQPQQQVALPPGGIPGTVGTPQMGQMPGAIPGMMPGGMPQQSGMPGMGGGMPPMGGVGMGVPGQMAQGMPGMGSGMGFPQNNEQPTFPGMAPAFQQPSQPPQPQQMAPQMTQQPVQQQPSQAGSMDANISTLADSMRRLAEAQEKLVKSQEVIAGSLQEIRKLLESSASLDSLTMLTLFGFIEASMKTDRNSLIGYYAQQIVGGQDVQLVQHLLQLKAQSGKG